jgi:PAS domain S-box-containing protein
MTEPSKYAGDEPLGSRCIALLRDLVNGVPVSLDSACFGKEFSEIFSIVSARIGDAALAEAALKETEQRFRSVTDSTFEAIVSTDKNGNIIFWNRGAENMFGYQNSEIAGRNIAMLMPSDERSAFLANITNQPIFFVHGLESVGICKNGSLFPIEISVSPWVSNEANCFTAIIRNITDRKKIEEELFRSRKLESVGVLAGGIAHDFNNILTGIITNLFIAKTRLNPSDETHRLIAEAEKAAFRASRLTSQLLTFSKGGAPVKENSSIRELIEESVGFTLSGANVECRLDLPQDLWMVEIDRGQIDQVLNNLIINALQAMPDGGSITLKASNLTIGDAISDKTETLLPLKPGTYIKLSVQDEGIGIPKSDLAKIFDPYFTTKPQGSGLGLATVYAIIKKHGGHITVRSKIGQGTVFTFYLPAIDSALVRTPAKESPVAIPQHAKRVLVMDDEEILRTVTSKLLKSAGYEVVCTSDGAEAIKVYKEALTSNKRFDVVVMDLTVSRGLGGDEAARRIFEIDQTARMIVASGYSNDPVMSNYREHHFSGVIHKPFSVDEFLRLIESVSVK